MNNTTLTLITCKRIDYFEKTLRSFVENCQDLHLISEIICIDDNSDFSEVEKIKELITKLLPNRPLLLAHKYLNKGQRYSMNFLWKNINTKYAFHLEDDWNFIRSGNFISDGLKILDKYQDIKQFLLVSGAENSKQITIDNNEMYTVLDWRADGHWWPNFSFRPGLYDIETMKKEIGFFEESNDSVEIAYAHKYAEKYKTAYMKIGHEYCTHLGEISSFNLNNTSHSH
jgi:hypothetical protein